MRGTWIAVGALALACGGQAAPPALGQLTPELRDRARAACGDRFVEGEPASEAVVLLPPAVLARSGPLVHAGCLAYPGGGVTGGLWLIYEPTSAALLAATIDVADAAALGPWIDALARAGLDGVLATRARAAAATAGASRDQRDGQIVIVSVGVNGVYRVAATVER